MVENRGGILAQGSRLEALTGPGGPWSGGLMLVEPGTHSRRPWGIAVIGMFLSLVIGPAQADVAIETPGRVETLPSPPSPHWVWVADGLLERTAGDVRTGAER